MKTIEQILYRVVNSPELHAKWLNTLSFLENCGARKIAACEHPTLVKEEMLKHASEEFRHAHYLKRQMGKISKMTIPDYSTSFLLGGVATLHYLNVLDLKTSRYLMKEGFSNGDLKEASYLLVTYAIELRAEKLYPMYDAILREMGSKVTVKSIYLEEKEHLSEMKKGLSLWPDGFKHAAIVCALEESIYEKWIAVVKMDLNGRDRQSGQFVH
jgi:hypothetical protein